MANNDVAGFRLQSGFKPVVLGHARSRSTVVPDEVNTARSYGAAANIQSKEMRGMQSCGIAEWE